MLDGSVALAASRLAFAHIPARRPLQAVSLIIAHAGMASIAFAAPTTTGLTPAEPVAYWYIDYSTKTSSHPGDRVQVQRYEEALAGAFTGYCEYRRALHPAGKPFHCTAGTDPTQNYYRIKHSNMGDAVLHEFSATVHFTSSFGGVFDLEHIIGVEWGCTGDGLLMRGSDKALTTVLRSTPDNTDWGGDFNLPYRFCVAQGDLDALHQRKLGAGSDEPHGAPSPVVNGLHLASGNAFFAVTDYQGPGGLHLQRFYNSGSPATALEPATLPGSSAMGRRWRTTFDRSLQSVGGLLIDSQRTVVAHRPDGSSAWFYWCDETEAMPGGRYCSGPNSIGTLHYRLDDQRIVEQELVLHDGSREYYDVNGRMTRWILADGTRLSLTRDRSTLTHVTDQQNRTLQFHYANAVIERVTLPDGSSLQYTHEGKGSGARLRSVQYPDATTQRYTYGGTSAPDDADLLTAVEARTGHLETRFSYDADGRVVGRESAEGAGRLLINRSEQRAELVDARGKRERFALQRLGGTTRVFSTDGATTPTMTYDANGRVASTVDAVGRQTFHHTTTDGRSSERIEAKGSPLERIVRVDNWKHTALPENIAIGDANSLRSLSLLRDDAGRIQRLLLDESGQQASWTMRYDDEGRVLSMSGPHAGAPPSQTMEYLTSDGGNCAQPLGQCAGRRGDLVRIRNAAGHGWDVLTRDGHGRVTSARDADGVEHTWSYTADGHVTSHRAKKLGRAMEEVRVIHAGIVQETIDADGISTRFVHDTSSNLTTVIDAAGNRREMERNAMGDVVGLRVRDASGAVLTHMRRTLDVDGRPLEQIDGNGDQREWQWNAAGELTSRSRPGQLTDITWDALGRPASTVTLIDNGPAQTTSQTYDALDRPLGLIDPKRLETLNIHGLSGRTALQSPDTGTTRWTRDAAGNPLTRDDAAGNRTTYTYDVLDRLTHRHSAPSQNDGSAVDHRFTYDTAAPDCGTDAVRSVGLLTQSISQSGALSSEESNCHGLNGAIVARHYRMGSVHLPLLREVSSAGRLLAMTWPDGLRADYRRDPAGAVSAIDVQLPDGTSRTLLHTVTRMAGGPVTGWTYGDGRALTRTRDGAARTTRIHDSRPGGLDLQLDYDGAGQPRMISSGGTGIALHHDGLGRLLRVDDAHTQTTLDAWTYDATGNRLMSRTAHADIHYLLADDSHRLLSVDGQPRDYDANGSLIHDAATGVRYAYDASGRMASVTRPDGRFHTFHYNARGEQVSRSGVNGGGQGRTHTLYDVDGHWLGEYDSEGTPLQQLIWLDEQPVGLVQDGRLYYVQADHLGTPRVIIDAARDAAVWQWDLLGESFGATPPAEDPDQDGAPFVFNLRYPGQRFDPATGLHYNYFRDYEPSTGRYVQSDPIGHEGGINTYAYVTSSPYSRTDPLGLKDYSECETREHLDKARRDATTGSFLQRTNAMLSNHSGLGIGAEGEGRMDFKINGGIRDTYTLQGIEMSSAQFGNYIAGYAGYYYGGSYGLAAVMWGGVAYDLKDTVLNLMLPTFDLDSRDDIADGARLARQEIATGIISCEIEE